MRNLASALGLVVAFAQAAQNPQPPMFRSAVDLVPVDVNIIDRNGRPVNGLEAADFVLTIDGRPRRIASAQYISAVRDVETPAAPAPSYYSSNTSAAGGRLMMLVVDQGNIGAGRGKLAIDAAGRFISRLSPSDRIGLVAIPGSGPQVDFTSNHALVKTMLPSLVGQAHAFQSPYRIGISEAVAIQRGDRTALAQLLDRECAGIREPAEIEFCTRQLTSDANSVFVQARERTRNSLIALRSLVERLSLTASPKTIILISEGLVIDRQLSEVSWFGAAASRGQIVLYVLQLEPPMFEASNSRDSPTRAEDLALGQEGLDILAGYARGTVLRVIATADTAFSRLATELSGYYLLSFEPEPGDRDGKVHKIKVETPRRSGVEIRARTEFAIDAVARKTEETVLADTLRAPLLASEIPIRATAYTLRDPASDKLRIVVAAEIDRSLNPDGKMSLAFTLVDSQGKLVASQFEPEVKTPVRPGSTLQTFTGSVFSESTGVHTLKLAALDDRGRRGSVEYSFEGRLTSAGQIRVTDFLIAENRGSANGGVVPAVSSDFTSAMLHGYVELYSDAIDVLKGATVVFEIAQSEQSRALDGAVAKVQPPAPESPNRRTAEGAVPIGLLSPGAYVARAVINVDGRKVGQVIRPLRIGRMVTTPPAPAPAPAASAGKPTTTKPTIVVATRPEAFDRSSVLTPQVVGFFLDRMNFGATGAPNAAPALEHARAGRFAEASVAMAVNGKETLPSAFLNGLALYSKGELEAAARQFRDTLRLDPEFFPAAFYLGACYAAGNKDQEAVAAWQMSLVTEREAPFIYTLLADALIRLKEANHAIVILNEAVAQWPDNDQVRLRMATALTMSGKPADGLAMLEQYLEKHPEDHAATLTALKTLYEARAAGKPVRSREEDKALFAKWAKAYAAAKGPQQTLVDLWQKTMNR
jgi:VWFA-related protein